MTWILFKGGEEGNETDVGRDKMSLLFSDIDDPQSTMESCIQELGEIQAETWEKLREEIQAKTEKGKSGRKEIPVQSWRKFSRLIRPLQNPLILSAEGLTRRSR